MKTNLFLATLALGLFFFAGSASAQIPYPGQLQFGVKAGLNTAWINADETFEDESPRLGIGGGLAVRYKFASLGVQGEAQYSQKGERCGDDCTIKIDYLEIPVLLRYAVPLSPLMTTGIYAGPSVGIPISNNLDEFQIGGVGEDPKTEFGLNVGVDVGSGPFYVDGRYNLGLTEIVEDGDSKNQHVQFTFGYWF